MSFLPQHRAVPFTSTAHVWSGPAAIATAVLIEGISNGVVTTVFVAAVPTWPSALKPQQMTAPPTRTAHACSRPAATAIASLSPCTPTGEASNRPAENPPGVGLLPSWPNELRPQHRTVPLTRTAHVKSCPAAIEATSVRPLTRPCAGLVTSGAPGPPAPLPICPN